MTDARATFRIRVAQALFGLTGDPEWATEIIDVLRLSRDWGERIDAAIALAGFSPTPPIVDALTAGVQDREYQVRYHCANTLLTLRYRTPDIASDPDLFPLISTSSRQADWQKAASQLTAGWRPAPR